MGRDLRASGAGTSRRRRRNLWALVVVGIVALASTALIALVGNTPGHDTSRKVVHASLSASQPAGSRTPIQHVVYILEENHSFDNLLGDWCVQTGRCDGATTGKTSSGTTIALSDAGDIVVDIGHASTDQVTAMDKGAMDHFDLVPGCASSNHYACYTQYTPAQEPNLIALTQTFALSDHTFGDGPAASWGMHLDAVATTMDGFTGYSSPQPGSKGVLGPGWGCDSGDDAPWISPKNVKMNMPSCVPDPALNASKYPYQGAYRATEVAPVPTIMDELDAADLSWRIYGGLGGIDNSNGYGWTICPSFAGCIYTHDATNLVDNSDVITDAVSGNLPNFSIVTPSQVDSEHNNDSMAEGDNWLGQVMSAIENGPDWSSTAVFVTWDDCGCFYDHVPPPPRRTIRVPLVIVSPYAKPGFTDSTPASYASILAFTEHTFGLAALSSLDGSAYDFQNSFDFTQKPLAAAHMVKQAIPNSEKQYLLQHPADPDDPT